MTQPRMQHCRHWATSRPGEQQAVQHATAAVLLHPLFLDLGMGMGMGIGDWGLGGWGDGDGGMGMGLLAPLWGCWQQGHRTQLLC